MELALAAAPDELADVLEDVPRLGGDDADELLLVAASEGVEGLPAAAIVVRAIAVVVNSGATAGRKAEAGESEATAESVGAYSKHFAIESFCWSLFSFCSFCFPCFPKHCSVACFRFFFSFFLFSLLLFGRCGITNGEPKCDRTQNKLKGKKHATKNHPNREERLNMFYVGQ